MIENSLNMITQSPASLFAFSFAMFLLAATPGPACFALIARSLSSGFNAGFGVATGIAIADLVYFIVALLGVATLSYWLAELFFYIKLAAGAYLIWLGIAMLRQKSQSFSVSTAASNKGYFDGLCEGLAVNLTNPKAIVFFAALLPSFFDLQTITLIDGLVIAAIIVIVGGCTDLVYVLLASRARGMVTGGSQRWLNRVACVTLVGVGSAVVVR